MKNNARMITIAGTVPARPETHLGASCMKTQNAAPAQKANVAPKQEAAKPVETQQAAAPQQDAKPEAPVPNIKLLKNNANFRGAREAWYKVLKEHDGKPADEFLKACTDSPPSRTKRGEAEPPSGWLRFFLRSGICQLVAPEQPSK
jgi:hypothetical protein